MKHEVLLERGEISVLQKQALRIPDAKYKPLLPQNYFNEIGNISEMGMRHNRIFYFLGFNTHVKAKPTSTIKLQIITNFKTVIDFAFILAFPRHLHEKSNENLSLRQNWLLSLQFPQL